MLIIIFIATNQFGSIMNAIRETVLALFFAGWIMLMAIKIHTNTSVHLYNTQENVITQQNLYLMTRILEYDLRKVGYGLANPLGAIHQSDSNRIIFSYDKNPFKVFDSIRVEYKIKYLNNKKSEMRLQRIENRHKRTLFPFKIARFRLKYYNQTGQLLPTPVRADSLSSIKEIEIFIALESKEKTARKYGKVFYKTRVVPKNLLTNYK